MLKKNRVANVLWRLKGVSMIHRLGEALALGYRLFHSSCQIVYGFWRLSKLPQPLVSIFGGTRMPLNTIYATKAEELSKRLTDSNISVVTGGGTGIMEAASRGASETKTGKGRSIGITVKGLPEETNSSVQECFELDYFFARKWLMTYYSTAFIFFPGGFGTIDELGEVLTLVQTKKLIPTPIVLVGTEYWQPFADWFRSEALRQGLVNDDDLKLFVITDDLNEVVTIIKSFCKTSCPMLSLKHKWTEK